MNVYKFVEDTNLSGTRITNGGYMVGDVRCARTGIQEYAGFEMGFDQEVVKVYRPEDEVFSESSLATFVGKPVTNDHPPEMVSADNWRKYAGGSIGNEVLRDGEFIRVPITLMDSSLIKQVKDGKREISMGYEMTLDVTPGETPQGEQYDAVMRNLKMNHLAVVDRGRAGPEVRIGDNWGASPNSNDGKETMTLKTIVVDGLSVETTDAGAKAIEKLQAESKAIVAAKDAAQTAHDSELSTQKADLEKSAADAVAEKDRELAKKDAEIDELKAKVLSDADLDKRVADRASLIAAAQKFAKDADFAGKSDLEIMTIAVDSVKGEGFCADKAPAYIEAAFDMAKPADKVREVLKSGVKTADAGDDDNGQSDYEKRLADAWKTKGAVA